MFVKKQEFVDEGRIIKEEEIQFDSDDEPREALCEIVEETYDLPETFHMLDESSGQMVELNTEDYLKDYEITFINALLQYDEINLMSMLGALEDVRKS